MNNEPFVSVILSAGASSRMGCTKAWLQLEGESLLQRAVRLSQRVGAHVIIALNEEPSPNDQWQNRQSRNHFLRAHELHDLSWFAADSVAYVEMPAACMPIDSLRAAIGRGHPSGVPVPFLVWPVDTAFVTLELLQALIPRRGPELIVRPEHHGKHGHPVLFGARIVPELLGPLADAGARGVVRRRASRLVDVPWPDERLFAELNTPEEAAALGVHIPPDVRDPPG